MDDKSKSKSKSKEREQQKEEDVKRSRSRKRSKSPRKRSKSRSRSNSNPRRRNYRRESVKRNNPPNQQIYIGHLPYNLRQEDLESHFAKYGEIEQCSIKRRFAFLTFEALEAAEQAVKEMHDQEFQGERIKVEFAGKRRSPRRRGRGPQNGDVCYNCNQTGHWANECNASPRGRRACVRTGGGGGYRSHRRPRSRRYRSSSRSESRDYRRHRSSRYKRSRRHRRSDSRDSRRRRKRKRSYSSRSNQRSKSRSQKRNDSPRKERQRSKSPKGKSQSQSRN